MQGWLTLVGSLAIIVLILTAFGIMLGIVKRTDAVNRVGAILGIVIVLVPAPGILAGVWSALFLWEQVSLVTIGVVVWQLRRQRRKPRKRRYD
jgi:hypothetical protein